jgi:hypothetical protein
MSHDLWLLLCVCRLSRSGRTRTASALIDTTSGFLVLVDREHMHVPAMQQCRVQGVCVCVSFPESRRLGLSGFGSVSRFWGSLDIVDGCRSEKGGGGGGGGVKLV